MRRTITRLVTAVPRAAARRSGRPMADGRGLGKRPAVGDTDADDSLTGTRRVTRALARRGARTSPAVATVGPAPSLGAGRRPRSAAPAFSGRGGRPPAPPTRGNPPGGSSASTVSGDAAVCASDDAAPSAAGGADAIADAALESEYVVVIGGDGDEGDDGDDDPLASSPWSMRMLRAAWGSLAAGAVGGGGPGGRGAAHAVGGAAHAVASAASRAARRAAGAAHSLGASASVRLRGIAAAGGLHRALALTTGLHRRLAHSQSDSSLFTRAAAAFEAARPLLAVPSFFPTWRVAIAPAGTADVDAEMTSVEPAGVEAGIDPVVVMPRGGVATTPGLSRVPRAPRVSPPGALPPASPDLGFGFSAGGLLFLYGVGVCEGLRDRGILTPTTPLAGASAGALIAAVAISGLSRAAVLDNTLRFMADCRTHGTYGRLGGLLATFLGDVLPADIHLRARGRVFVAVTRLYPRVAGELVSEWADRDDFIASLLTSCHIPLYFDRSRVATRFRDGWYCDGGFANFLPRPPTCTRPVGVCCLPDLEGHLQGRTHVPVSISPSIHTPAFPAGFPQMLQWALSPADDTTQIALFDRGREDANRWADAEEARVQAGEESADGVDDDAEAV